MNPEDLIPASLQQELEALGDQGDDAAWRLGDIAEDLCEEYRGRGARPKDVYQAMGLYCGKVSDTIRGYRYLSARVPPGLRKAYPQLSRGHHKMIADKARGDIALHETLCDTFIEEVGFGSVERLAAWLGDPSTPIDWVRVMKRILSGARKLLECEGLAPSMLTFAENVYAKAIEFLEDQP